MVLGVRAGDALGRLSAGAAVEEGESRVWSGGVGNLTAEIRMTRLSFVPGKGFALGRQPPALRVSLLAAVWLGPFGAGPVGPLSSESLLGPHWP